MAAQTRGAKATVKKKKSPAKKKAAKKKVTAKKKPAAKKKTVAKKSVKQVANKKVTKKKAAKKTVARKVTKKKVTKKTAVKKTVKKEAPKKSPAKKAAPADLVPRAVLEIAEARLAAMEAKQIILDKRLRAQTGTIEALETAARQKPVPSVAVPTDTDADFEDGLDDDFLDEGDPRDSLSGPGADHIDLASILTSGDDGIESETSSEPVFETENFEEEEDGFQSEMTYDDYDDDSDFIVQTDGIPQRRRELDRERADRELELEDEEFWLVCPKCGEHLVEHDFDNIKVERCESCGVVSLDKGEIELLLSTDDPRTVHYRTKGLLQ